MYSQSDNGLVSRTALGTLLTDEGVGRERWRGRMGEARMDLSERNSAILAGN